MTKAAANNRFGIMVAGEYGLSINSYIHLLNQGLSIEAMNSTTLPSRLRYTQLCDSL